MFVVHVSTVYMLVCLFICVCMCMCVYIHVCIHTYGYIYTRTKNHFNKMKKEVGMLLQKRTDTSAVGIYKLYEENTH